MHIQDIRCESGYGLPATILMLVLLTVMGLLGVSIARQEVRTQMRTSAREKAFYAAELALAKGLDNWSTPAGVVSPGTAWLLDQGSLPGGASYAVEAVKLSAGGVHSLYALNAEGKAADGTIGRVGLLMATRPLDDPFKAALSVRDTAFIAGTATVEGYDNIPSSWDGPYCGALDDDQAGLMMADSNRYERKGAAKIVGSPNVSEDPDTTGFFDLGEWSYDQLAAEADIGFSTNTDVAMVAPSYNADGSCKTSDDFNWGDPENPNRACSDWFPIIHAAGNLTLSGNFAGQGLLLVDGDLTAAGGTRFYGPIIVKGNLIAAGAFNFYGGVKSKDTDLGVGTANIYYSACVLQRALSNTKASKPTPVTGRPWFERR